MPGIMRIWASAVLQRLLMSAVGPALKTYCDVTAAVLVGVKFAAQKMYDVHMRLVNSDNLSF